MTGLLLALATGGALADGVSVPELPWIGALVPAPEIEDAAAKEYHDMLLQALQQKRLGPDNHPQVIRLRAIAQRIIAFIGSPNLHATPRAAAWKWEVNLIDSDQINAFCMPGGKIVFFTAILKKLKLTDDEVAVVMGHEIAHALREHARERLGSQAFANGAISLVFAFFGLGNSSRYFANMGSQLLTLKFGREDESEADKIGLDLAARAGYDPAAGITLWQKMDAAGKAEAAAAASSGKAVRGPTGWFATHPPSANRIADLRADMPAVSPLYRKAAKPPQVFEAMN